MPRHWKFEDDEFLAAYFDDIGDFIGTHDLGRPKGAATKRVAHLKAIGAWDALQRRQEARERGNTAMYRAELDYAKCLGFEVVETGVPDDEAYCPADIYDEKWPWRRHPYGEEEHAGDEQRAILLTALIAAGKLLRAQGLKGAVLNQVTRAIAQAGPV